LENEFEQIDAQLSESDLETREEVAKRIQSEEARADISSHFKRPGRLEVIDTLSEGVAHNFNNLLMGILGRVSLMKAQFDQKHPIMEHVIGIEENVHIAVRLINRIMECTSKEEYTTRPVNSNWLIENTAKKFGRGKKGLRIFKVFDDGLWLVNINQVQLENALLKLLLNAWHAMPDGGDLFIRTENVVFDEGAAMQYSVNQGRYVKISIADTGVGMEKDTLDRIFDPFFSTKTIKRGTGLGLSLVYRVITNHGGFINAYSEVGKGSTVSIWLPAIQ
jgi:signal transduction histidine kinase